MKNQKNARAVAPGCVLLLACMNAFAQEAGLPEDTVALELFKGPRFIKPPSATYPESERIRANEGWVTLNFMIDPQGKPYEISVMGSTGNAAFEKTAIKAVERTTFQPAMLGNKAIDSGFMMKMKFYMGAPAKGASSGFISAWKKLGKAIEAGDRAQADEVINSLKVQNLYEDAYRNLGVYSYARKWGTDVMQLAALKGAVAGEDDANYLPRGLFRSALSEMLRLQVKRQDYGAALNTWEKLKKIARKEDRQVWQPVMDEVEAARKDDRAAHLSDRIGSNGSWFSTLFKNRFEVRVASGKVNEIKLRCEKGYVFFRYDPKLAYTVSDRDDKCSIELVGEPETQFTLVQTQPG
jgi:TonB family protein